MKNQINQHPLTKLLDLGVKIKCIAAMSENRVIGKGPNIPWHYPEDFKWFKSKTLNNIMLMGRTTYESIGRPLPKRTTLVLSTTISEYPKYPEVKCVSCIKDINSILPDKEWKDKTLWICGGSKVYKQAFPLCSELYLTRIKKNVEGDIFLPKFEDLYIKDSTNIQDNSDFTIEKWILKDQ